jgi:hypothetical protein
MNVSHAKYFLKTIARCADDNICSAFYVITLVQHVPYQILFNAYMYIQTSKYSNNHMII